MKGEISIKSRRHNVLKHIYIIYAALILAAMPISGGQIDNGNYYESDAIWEPLTKSTNSTRDHAAITVVDKKVEDVLAVFRRSLPFNPPKGFAVVPRLEYLKPITLPGNTYSPEPFHIRLGVRMPPHKNNIVAGLNVWINDPYNILGEPLLSDNEGELFLLPPEIGTMAGEKIISRMAHPPGYENEYPSGSMFPLWAENQEPFLRAVVRPSFGLAKATVTTVYTANNSPFWKPVSQERWINAMIAAAERVIGDITSGISAADEFNLTEQQANELKNRIERMRQAYSDEAIINNYSDAIARLMPVMEMLKTTQPDLADEAYESTIGGLENAMEEALIHAVEIRKEINKMEEQLLGALIQREGVWKQIETAINQGDWDAIESIGSEHNLGNMKLIADAGRSIGRLRAELAAMSPAQRRAPAYGFLLPEQHPLGTHRQVVAMEFIAERASGLVSANEHGARAIVSINPDFFNFSDSEAPIKLMAVEYWGRSTLTYDNNRRNLLDDIWQFTDWQMLKSMVR